MKMQTKLQCALLTLVLGMLTGSPLLAGIPFGSITNGPFNGPLNSIYDLSGTYTFVEIIDMGDEMPLEVRFQISLSQDARGKILGGGNAEIFFFKNAMNVGTILNAQGIYKAKGKIATSGEITRVLWEVNAKGFGTILGINQNFQIKSKFQSEISPSSQMMVGNSRGTAKGTELGTFKFDNMTAYTINPLMNGSWRLEFNITPDLNKLRGIAILRLSNGAPLFMRIVKGEYKDSTDESAMKLKGFFFEPNDDDAIRLEVDSVGSSLKTIRTRASGREVISYKGIVMGQKVEWESMPVQ